MNHYDALNAAREAVTAHPNRPATATIHDVPGARLVVFRIEPGQQVVPHVSEATVLLTVLSGTGVLSGGDGEVTAGPGAVAAFAPNELHGMRAIDQQFVLLATIVRPH